MMQFTEQYQYWVVVKDPDNHVSYFAYPLVLDDAAGTCTIRYQETRTTITALTEAGARLILEVDDIHHMISPRVLYNADGGNAGVIRDERTAP